MNIMRHLVPLSLIAVFAVAQSGPEQGPSNALVNDGKPMRVPASCTEDEIQSWGMACSADQPCPIYLDLSTFDVYLNRIVLAGSLHTESTALASVVLLSEDAGNTWTEPVSRVKQASVDQVQFADPQTGWIAGQILSSIPRDPFFLLTVDGGKTWKHRPVFGETHAGTVEKFLFANAKQGKVIVDRGRSAEGGRWATLETQTGGDSWSIQQITTRMPAVDWDRPAATAWRLQTNPQSKTVRLEKREGAAWTSTAEFFIQTGLCSPRPIELAPPPEPTAPASAESDAVEVFQIGGPRKPAAAKAKPKKK